ncbi:hypothetical protein [Chitinibacter tainanensis]|nr:hypothetical protein [Chitinibacter tainanensis]
MIDTLSHLLQAWLVDSEETLEEYEAYCISHGYRYTRTFQNGLPILERLQ